MKNFWFLTALALLICGGALAQDEHSGTIPASQPVAHSAQVSVRDMTPEQRQQFWNNLPEADKKRILMRRMAMQIQASTPVKPGEVSPNAKTPAPGETDEAAQKRFEAQAAMQRNMGIIMGHPSPGQQRAIDNTRQYLDEQRDRALATQ
jgi:hypothetical protein